MKQIAVVLVLAVVLLAGCGGPNVTPSTQYVNAANFAADRFDEMAILIQLGAFDQKQREDIQRWTDVAKNCLDDWHANLATDPNAKFDAIESWRCARSALAKLLWYQENAPPAMQRAAIKQ